MKQHWIVIMLLMPAWGYTQKQGTDISTGGWRLWLDKQAAWKDDSLYLPAEVNLDKMPVNPPTGGWGALNDQSGIGVRLPTTVEEHYWGANGLRPYTKNEAQKGAGTSFPNGNYPGVSWWWREFMAPAFKPGQRVTVSFRGARLRAEVYCNNKLCGYTIMGELPFMADITDAVRPGEKARLALRITNPGGFLDWIDFAQMQIQWGKYTLPPSHGFGGLDNDIVLAVRDNVSVTDIAVINKADLHEVTLVAELSSTGDPFNGKVHFSISRAGKNIWSHDSTVNIAAGETKTVKINAHVSAAQPWDTKHPNLYTASAGMGAFGGRSVLFGFRFFTAEGIGSSAKLLLNGKRIVPLSAISWGYWGRNGLWPDRAMAEREVSVAKAMGLNTLQFHRNIGRPAVLDIQDREGLLRCEEPGGGKFILGHRYAQGPFGPNGEFLGKDEKLLDALKPAKDYLQPDTVNTSGGGPDGDGVTFWEKYAEEKIMEMVKRDRSHPSLIMYTIQNESNEMDLRNPRIYRVLRRMQELDPGRVIAFYSGGVPKEAQVLVLPYHHDILYGSKMIPFAGWRDVHTCGGPVNYMDNMYTDPQHFKQRNPAEDHRSINMWGEMLGSASPDNYDRLVHSFNKEYPSGYELSDARQVLDGYHGFLDKWGFRKAFPTDSSLFAAIGYRTYYFWKRAIEQGRMDNNNDYLVVSGWESTTIDNHSGLVDNHRFPKGDPALIKQACGPEVLVIQPRHVIMTKGGMDTVDIFLINETGRSGPQRLDLVVKRADGSIAYKVRKNVDVAGGDVYGQLLAEGIGFTADAAGMMKLEASLSPVKPGASVLRQSDEINVVEAQQPLLQKIAVFEPGKEISSTLSGVFHITALPLQGMELSARVDAIVIANTAAGNDLYKPTGANTAITKEIFENALQRVSADGARLVLVSDNDQAAEAFAKVLAAHNIIKFSGMAGNLNAPWFGSWFFTRRHWLLNGLPVNCAVDWRYGISAFNGPEWLKEEPRRTSTNGFLLEAPGAEVAIGYGADHSPKIGISACVIPYGKGEILLYCLPQMVRSLQPGNFAMPPAIAQRLLGNALAANGAVQK